MPPTSPIGKNNLDKQIWLWRILGFLVICVGLYIRHEYDSFLGFILIGLIGLLIMRLGHKNKKGPFD